MKYYAGIDVSLNSSNVCVVDASGKIVREGKVASEPVTLITWLGSLGVNLERIGLEAGPLSQWLYGALREAGLAVELLETRHVKTALSTMPVKTDRNDARGIAQLMRLGWFRPVHCKSMAAQEVRALLTARKLVQSKLYDIEMSLRGILRGFGLKVGPTTSPSFAARINHLVDGQTSLEVVAAALLPLHAVALREFKSLEKSQISRADARARLLMSTPGVGPLVALTYVAAPKAWSCRRAHGSTIRRASPHQSRWGHILGSLRKSINRVRPMSAAGSARWATVRCAPPSMRPPTSS
jgi:transposase